MTGTEFERDLGITGDDGDEILRRVAEYYDIKFTAKSFDLGPNEYLFNSEGFDLFCVPLRMILGRPEPKIRFFIVGELYDATLKEYANQNPKR